MVTLTREFSLQKFQSGLLDRDWKEVIFAIARTGTISGTVLLCVVFNRLRSLIEGRGKSTPLHNKSTKMSYDSTWLEKVRADENKSEKRV